MEFFLFRYFFVFAISMLWQHNGNIQKYSLITFAWKFTCNLSSFCVDFAAGDPTHDGGVIKRSQYEPSKNIMPDGFKELSWS